MGIDETGAQILAAVQRETEQLDATDDLFRPVAPGERSGLSAPEGAVRWRAARRLEQVVGQLQELAVR